MIRFIIIALALALSFPCGVCAEGLSNSLNTRWNDIQDEVAKYSVGRNTEELNKILGYSNPDWRYVKYSEFEEVLERLSLQQKQINTASPTVTSGDSTSSTVNITMEDVILTDMTLNVGSGQTYATIYDALDWLAQKRIKAEIIVTIQVADGTYTIAEPLIMRHSQGNQIHIFGNRTDPTLCKLVIDREGRTDRGNCFVVENQNALIIDGFWLVGDGYCNFDEYTLEFTGNGVRAAWGGVVAMGSNMIVEGFCHNYAALHGGIMMANGTYNATTGRYENGPVSKNPVYYGFLAGLHGYMQAAGTYSTGGHDNYHASSGGRLHCQDSKGETALWNNFIAANQGFIGANRCEAIGGGSVSTLGGGFGATTGGYTYAGTDNPTVAVSSATNCYYGAYAKSGGVVVTENMTLSGNTIDFHPPQNVQGPSGGYNQGVLNGTTGIIFGVDKARVGTGALNALEATVRWEDLGNEDTTDDRLEFYVHDGNAVRGPYAIGEEGTISGNVWPDSAVDIRGSSLGTNGITAEANDFHIQSGANRLIIDSGYVVSLVGLDANSGFASNRFTGRSGEVGAGALTLEALITSVNENERGFMPKIKLHEVPYASPQTDPYGITMVGKVRIADNINYQCDDNFRLELDGYLKATGAEFFDNVSTGYGTDELPKGLAATHITSRHPTGYANRITMGVVHDGDFYWLARFQDRLASVGGPNVGIKKLLVGDDISANPGLNVTLDVIGSTVLGVENIVSDAYIGQNQANIRFNTGTGNLEFRYRGTDNSLSTHIVGASTIPSDLTVNTLTANNWIWAKDKIHVGAYTGPGGSWSPGELGDETNNLPARLYFATATQADGDSNGLAANRITGRHLNEGYLQLESVDTGGTFHPKIKLHAALTSGVTIAPRLKIGAGINTIPNSGYALDVDGTIHGSVSLASTGMAAPRYTGYTYSSIPSQNDVTLGEVAISSTTFDVLMKNRHTPRQTNIKRLFVGDVTSTAASTIETSGTTIMGCNFISASNLQNGQWTIWFPTAAEGGDGALYIYARNATYGLRTFRIAP